MLKVKKKIVMQRAHQDNQMKLCLEKESEIFHSEWRDPVGYQFLFILFAYYEESI